MVNGTAIVDRQSDSRWGEVGVEFVREARALPLGRRGSRASRGDARPWVIVLAGGEGRRLHAFTRGADGVAVPKQFVRFRDARTLLRTTIDRAARLAGEDRVVPVVLESHRDWWRTDLADLPSRQVLAQPAARGTAVAVLHALEHIRGLDPDARVVLMPSDHDVDDEDSLHATLRHAVRASADVPGELVILGVVPTSADTEFGLVVPRREASDLPRVRTFIEKPEPAFGVRLLARGALWNSFLAAGGVRLLADLYERALPRLARAYRRGAMRAFGGRERLWQWFAQLPDHDFVSDLVVHVPGQLRLATVPACGWTDLGTPARLAAWLERHPGARYREERPALALVATGARVS